MKLYYNNKRQEAQNSKYPYETEIKTIEDLRKVVAYDHVSAKFKDDYRKNDNFICSDCNMFDVDNTHSDNADEWITPAKVKEAFPNVAFYVVYSRNHMKVKDNKEARPKFHIYFQDVMFEDMMKCKLHKEKVCAYFPYFDNNAKDVARFFFGVENPQIEYHEGYQLLYEFMETVSINNNQIQISEEEIIPAGCRNKTLFSFACRILKRKGNTDEAFNLYMEETTKCVPPLDNKEILSIWDGALKYFNKPSRSTTQIQKSWYILPTDAEAVQQLYLPSVKNRRFSIAVAKLILQAIGVTIRLNDMNRQIEINGLPEELGRDNLNNVLTTIVADIASDVLYKRATAPIVQETLNVIAQEKHYHPVITLLESKNWDGSDRIEEIYNILGIDDNFYKTLVRKWAIQTIAVLFNSDSKPIATEGVLVLQGKQGIGKTQFFSHLAIKECFFKGGATLDMSNKDSLMSATKIWICELGEIDSTTKKEQSALKAFLTEKTDRFREPYARCETIKPRRTSFCGTVNPKAYLRDETGNRRYWTIPVENINLKKIFDFDEEWYAQFWRQILVEYRKNPKGYLLTCEEKEMINVNNSEYEVDGFGQDEFMTLFDLTSDKSKWCYKTASEIASMLCEKFKYLKISGAQVGKLLNQIEQRENMQFVRKTVNGRRMILCPMLSSIISQRSMQSQTPFVALDNVYIPSDLENIQDAIDDNPIF